VPLQARAHVAPAADPVAAAAPKKRKAQDITSFVLTEHQRRAFKTLFARAIYEGGLPLSWADRPATKRFTEVTHNLKFSYNFL